MICKDFGRYHLWPLVIQVLWTGVTDKQMWSIWISQRPLTRCHTHTGDYSINCSSTGLEDLLTSGSVHGSLSAFKTGVRWPNLRFSPCTIWCSCHFLDFHNWSSGQYQVIRSPLCRWLCLYRNIKTLTDCQILQDDLSSLGPIGKWNLMLPNVIQWGWPGTSLAIKNTLNTHCINKHWNRFRPPNTLELLLLTTWNGVSIWNLF